ncbi:TetR family transcriptional regulator [Tamaricihabitans halophyticus]|uniref:TetR family transcriptional regulator n=1 Tax=Tamaricihabitans halophyticus TaxID=1262583 RepID=A0A4R2QA56_9PSEU|nr:TetR/AcrR family transcriptional regulator [Tamaricihabitans halophyticus]TCP45054.1 TetR family transcriptional regulator [Tamaricihabitans halophyticus]
MSSDESAPRQRLLAEVVRVMTENGSTGWSLRSLAEATGTSHRMLIYHFASLDGVLLAVVRLIDDDARDRFAAVAAEHGDQLTAARAWWRQLADPERAAGERLYFELYAAALQGKSFAQPLLRGAVTDWLPPLTAAFTELTGQSDPAHTDARLGVAVVRGLLLDLLATGDLAAVTAAHERYLGLYANTREQQPD